MALIQNGGGLEGKRLMTYYIIILLAVSQISQPFLSKQKTAEFPGSPLVRTEELMLSNFGAVEDSGVSLGQQGEQTSPS